MNVIRIPATVGHARTTQPASNSVRLSSFYTRRHILRLFITLALVAYTGVGLANIASALSLDDLSADLSRRFDTITHISPQDLAQKMKSDGNVLLIDTREAEEYAVSHLAGAERLDPGAWYWEFSRRFADKVRGRSVVFYCSVGVRSSRMAEHVREVALAAGAKEVLNLKGGIFAWHNAHLPLVDNSGPTDFVHPYDDEWGQLVERGEMRRMHPSLQPEPDGE